MQEISLDLPFPESEGSKVDSSHTSELKLSLKALCTVIEFGFLSYAPLIFALTCKCNGFQSNPIMNG